MNRVIFAVTALMAAAAAPAVAQTAPVAPAAGYVSSCPKPKLEPYPSIPNAATARPEEVAKASAAYQAWNLPINAFVACKHKEFAAIDAEADSVSPAAKEVNAYAKLVANFNQEIAVEKAGGVDATIIGKPPKLAPGAPCPPMPAWTPGPTPPTPADGKKLNKAEATAAHIAFSNWATPYAGYFECQGPRVKQESVAASAQLAPLQAKQAAAQAEFDAVGADVNAFQAKWNAFASAYNARVTAAGH